MKVSISDYTQYMEDDTAIIYQRKSFNVILNREI